MSNNQSEITNAIIGGILASIGMTTFVLTHNHRLNLSDILWAMTSFREKWLPEYFPLVSGIFLISGILFNVLQYQNVNNYQPYGPKDKILARTSMYGFAFSGFCFGIGAKLAGGDIIYHGFIGVARKSPKSITVLIIVIALAMFWSWLLDFGLVNFFANSQVNPPMEFLHIQSASITIFLACLLSTISLCWLRSRDEEFKTIFKKIGGSFLAGLLLGLGFTLCGLSRRTQVFQSLTPGRNWSAVLIIFIAVIIFLNFITYQLLLKKIVLNNQQIQTNALFEQTEQFLQIKAIAGSVLIGTGWGIGGLDLTTYFIHSAIFSIPVVVIFGVFLVLGTMIGDNFDDV